MHVGHDLDGAAYSTYAGDPAITCIIGTGSNSCYFDGSTTSEKVPALAYILGDEASGSWFGKRLLALHLYHKLDPTVDADFVSTFGFSKDDIVNRVYQEPNANVFLASFMTFIGRHQEVPQIISLLEEGFQAYRCASSVTRTTRMCQFTLSVPLLTTSSLFFATFASAKASK